MNGKFNPKTDTIRAFSSQIKALFRLSKKGKTDIPHFPLVWCLLVWLNLHQYSWISLNILEIAWIKLRHCFWLCQSSKYACYFPYLTVLKMLWIVYASVTQSFEYIWIWSNMPQYALMSLNMPRFSNCLIILDIWHCFEYSWDIKYARVLNIHFIVTITW